MFEDFYSKNALLGTERVQYLVHQANTLSALCGIVIDHVFGDTSDTSPGIDLHSYAENFVAYTQSALANSSYLVKATRERGQSTEG